MAPNRPVVLVTGASSGIGLACARALLATDHRVVAGCRNTLDLAPLQQEFGGNVLPMEADIRDRALLQAAWSDVGGPALGIDAYIHAAGVGLGDQPYADEPFGDKVTMVETNLVGVLNCLDIVLPAMRATPIGRLVLIGSRAVHVNSANSSTYAATKSAATRIFKDLRISTAGAGLKISVVHPGRTRTEFHQKRAYGDKLVAQAEHNAIVPLEATDVARVVEFILTAPAHVCIDELTVSPLGMPKRGGDTGERTP